MSDILERAMAGMMGCCDCEDNAADFRLCGMEISRLRFEVERLRLTDAEREAIAYAHLYLTVNGFHPVADRHNETLGKLLARLPETSTPPDA